MKQNPTCKEAHKTKAEYECPVLQTEGEGDGREDRDGGGEYYEVQRPGTPGPVTHCPTDYATHLEIQDLTLVDLYWLNICCFFIISLELTVLNIPPTEIRKAAFSVFTPWL